MRQWKNGTPKLVALLVLTYVFAKFQGGFVSWFLFYSCLTFAGYELLCYLLMFATLTVTREIDKNRLKDGEDVVVCLRLKRRIWFPLGWNLVVEPLPDKLAGYYEPHRQVIFPWFKREMEIRYVIPNLPRGYYQLDECEVRAGDFFGFIQKTKKFSLNNHFLVYPSYKAIRYWSFGDGRISGNIQVSNRRSDDISAVRGVRDYHLGDRLSQIHWRASARGVGLKTKEFEHQAMNQLIFFLDVEEQHYRGKPPELFEMAVKLAASLVYYASRRMYPFGFVYKERERVAIPSGHTHAHLFRVFDQLARVSPEGEEPFAYVIGREALEFPPGFAIVAITPAVDKHMVARLVQLSHAGRNVHLFWVQASEPTPEEKEAWRLLCTTKVVCRTVHLGEFDELQQIGGAIG